MGVNLLLSHIAENIVADRGSTQERVLAFEAPMRLTPLRYVVKGTTVPNITIMAANMNV